MNGLEFGLVVLAVLQALVIAVILWPWRADPAPDPMQNPFGDQTRLPR